MILRALGASRIGGTAAEALRRLNSRHPWSHNDHFHSWIVANLPDRRSAALDVGCGQGELAATLAAHFQSVLATDRDEEMRRASKARCARLTNVVVTGTQLAQAEGPFDLITMVAVLHHLDVERALLDTRRLLAPGGRLLIVGLAPPHGPVDHLWDAMSMAINPLIGFVKHPWPSPVVDPEPPFPVAQPTLTFAELRGIVDRILPGAKMRHHLAFRHTIEWTQH